MEEQNNYTSGFEFVDIEIIDHNPEVKSPQKWDCDQCSLFYLKYDSLMEHKKKHMNISEVNCRYCNKVLSVTEESKECYANKKCETCEYRCSQCPQRFLRQSSLMNHENNHLQQKNKKTSVERSVNKHLSETSTKGKIDQKNKKKNVLKVVEPEALSSRKSSSGPIVESNVPNKRKRKLSSSPIKKTSLQTVADININGSDTGASSIKMSKRSGLKLTKLVKEKNYPKLTKQPKEQSPVKYIKNANKKPLAQKIKKPISTTDITSRPTSGNEINSVNYKPFSCHVCNDNFASENILLDHIQSHGDAAKSFKCKFCTEEFDTIYDMQYHLAVCPLAEDELECSLKNSTPPKFLTKSMKTLNNSLSQPKRGRPKKSKNISLNTKEETITSDKAKMAAPLVARSSKRKSITESREFLNKIPKVTSHPVRNRQQKLPKSVKAQSDVSENDASVYSSSENLNDLSNESLETGVINQKKHNCPFPRCDSKFTREKALECHMRNHDDFDDSLKCHKCDIPFDDIKTLRMHVDECQGLREEKDDDFSGPKQMRAEKQSIKTTRPQKPSGDFLCKTCGKAYHTMESLKRHMAGHSSSNFVCQICKDDFSNQTLLDQHFLDLHPTKTSHHCDTCNEDFISEFFLQIHDSEYHSTSSKRLKQEFTALVDTKTKSHPRNKSINSKRFNNSGYLQKIVSNALANRDDNIFWCPVCFESFNKRENLRDHFRSNHTFGSGSVYTCELCDIEKPSAEMICWHLEVHSINKLSVNRFSKLRTCVGIIKKEDTENYKQLPETNLNLHMSIPDGGGIKKKTMLNDLKILTKKETCYMGDGSTQETLLKTDSNPEHRKKGLKKEYTVKKVTASRLKFSLSKPNKISHSQLNLKSLTKSKLNRFSLKKILPQVNNTITPHMMKDDNEIEGNNLREIISGSTTKLATNANKDKSLKKLEGDVGKCFQRKYKRRYKTKAKSIIHNKNVTNHEDSDNDNYKDNKRSKVLDEESGLISGKIILGSDTYIIGESVNNPSVNESTKNTPLDETTEVQSINKTTVVVKSTNYRTSVESTKNTTVTQSNEIVQDLEARNFNSKYKPSARLTCEEDAQNYSEARICELSLNSQEDNEESPSCDLKNKSVTQTYFEPPVNQTAIIKSILARRGKSRFRNLKSRCPTKHKKGYIKNTKKYKKTVMSFVGTNLKYENKESNKKIMYDTESNLNEEVKSSLVANNDAETLYSLSGDTRLLPNLTKERSLTKMKKISPRETPDSSKIKNECQNIKSNVIKGSDLESSENKIKTKRISSEISVDYSKPKMQASVGSSNEESKDSSEKDVFCGANNVVSETTDEQINSGDSLKEIYVKMPGKSSIFEDLQEATDGKLVLNYGKENSLSVSALNKNSLEYQSDNPSDDVKGIETKSISLQSKSSKEDHYSEDSKNEPNELFEEISCDKCSLKFYNQDDLFDHLGSHYDI